MRRVVSVVLTASASTLGCGETDATAGTTTSGDPHRDASTSVTPVDPDSLPPEERSVTLTLWPLYDPQFTEAGYGDFLPLDDVEVCVDRARPQGGTWEDFVLTGSPCTTTVAGEDIVLEGVPAMSELLVVANKEGYRPTLIPVVTGGWDTDVTAVAPTVFSFTMLRLDSGWPAVEVDVLPDGAVISVQALGCAGLSCTALGDVALEMDPPSGDGPYFGRGGTFDPLAERTLPGVGTGNALSSETADPPTGDGMSFAPGAVFVNISEAEYTIGTTHDAAFCRARGWFHGDVTFGFPSEEVGVVRVPVLAGHFVPMIQFLCECVFNFSPGSDPLAPSTCLAKTADAGADAGTP